MRANSLLTCRCIHPSADPGARTTDSSLQDACLRAAAALGRPLFGLFAHPAARVADGAAVLMRAIAECGAAAAAPMRDAALREGALLHHLQLALFAAGERMFITCWRSSCTSSFSWFANRSHTAAVVLHTAVATLAAQPLLMGLLRATWQSACCLVRHMPVMLSDQCGTRLCSYVTLSHCR
jgi:hypothetical protein